MRTNLEDGWEGNNGLENRLVFVWPVESYVRRRPGQSIHLLLWGLSEADRLRVWCWRIFSAGSGHVDRGAREDVYADVRRWAMAALTFLP